MLDRLTGWSFVGVAGLLMVAMIGRAVQGFSAGWWEWPVVAAMAALMFFVGLALLIDEPPVWLLLTVLAGYGVSLVAFGLFLLILPDAAVVDAGRGPRTPGAARLMGVFLVASGAVVGAGATFMARTRR